jgi:hypothetical protein
MKTCAPVYIHVHRIHVLMARTRRSQQELRQEEEEGTNKLSQMTYLHLLIVRPGTTI